MEYISQQIGFLRDIDFSVVAYPFAGILFTATHFQDLAEPVAKSLSIALATSLATIVPLILLTLGMQTKLAMKALSGIDPSLPRATVLGIRLAKWIALLMCAFEASLVVYLVLGAKLDATRASLFRDVLLSRTSNSVGAYVSADPLYTLPAAHTAASKTDQIKTLHDLATIASTQSSPMDVFTRPVHAALGFALQFIPVLGPLMYGWLEGERTGIASHVQLFKLKDMKPDERAQWVLARRDQYAQFGFTAAMLEAIPVVGAVTKYTNAVGAALWAADLEQRQAELRKHKSH
ncbi:hypothetical protein HDU87_001212 [Geranomyces variabilis]|uniref:Uncharacterized protein n=1 Tax=Geranomyces variabilis TaxID=109894 RepID=A0AAD5XLY6_9FUNG|nr:hypothetical protein HDU87_001212 [Geranomyces variabilis]